MGRLGIGELIVILIIALVIFGPSKLPEVGKSIGLAINEFKGAMGGSDDKKAKSVKTEDDSNDEEA